MTDEEIREANMMETDFAAWDIPEGHTVIPLTRENREALRPHIHALPRSIQNAMPKPPADQYPPIPEPYDEDIPSASDEAAQDIHGDEEDMQEGETSQGIKRQLHASRNTSRKRSRLLSNANAPDGNEVEESGDENEDEEQEMQDVATSKRTFPRPITATSQPQPQIHTPLPLSLKSSYTSAPKPIHFTSSKRATEWDLGATFNSLSLDAKMDIVEAKILSVAQSQDLKDRALVSINNFEHAIEQDEACEDSLGCGLVVAEIDRLAREEFPVPLRLVDLFILMGRLRLLKRKEREEDDEISRFCMNMGI